MAITQVAVNHDALEQYLASGPGQVAVPDLTSLPKEQRTAWVRALQDREVELDQRARLEKARLLWDPITLTSRRVWETGSVVEEHWFWQHWPLDMLSDLGMVLATVLSGTFGVIGAVIAVTPNVTSGAVVVVLSAGFAVVATLLLRWGARRCVDSCRVFTQPMPIRAVQAYHEAVASGLFDDIMVYATNPNAFDVRVSARFNSVDPLLIGRIGKFSFLLAYWDLSADIEVLSARAVQA